MLPNSFFDRDASKVARELLGMVIRRRWNHLWLSARIIETEAYYCQEKGSHAHLGYTFKRRALFMSGGTIYMYYARGGDSLNVSTQGAGNAVLIKSAYPWCDDMSLAESLVSMQALNPTLQGLTRPVQRLCAGQTLLCRALNLKVIDWDAQAFDPENFFIEDIGVRLKHIIQTTRLGIPIGRDEHLPYRYVDPAYAAYCTRNPLRRGQRINQHYSYIDQHSFTLVINEGEIGEGS